MFFRHEIGVFIISMHLFIFLLHMCIYTDIYPHVFILIWGDIYVYKDEYMCGIYVYLPKKPKYEYTCGKSVNPQEV